MSIRAMAARAVGAAAMLAGLAQAADAQAIRGQVWAADGASTAGLRVRAPRFSPAPAPIPLAVPCNL